MRTCSTSETCGVAGAGAMGMADAAGDAMMAPNRDAATRPVLRFMMSSSAYAIQDIEVVLIKLWRNRNVMLMNKSSAKLAADLTFRFARLSQVRARDQCCACTGAAWQDIAFIFDPAQFAGTTSSLVLP
jgi:hypothetical protein